MLMLQNGRLDTTAIQIISNIIRAICSLYGILSLCQSREESHTGFMWKMAKTTGI